MKQKRKIDGSGPRIKDIINEAIPNDRLPKFTPEQIEKLKTAGGITLAIIGVAGVITLSAIAPNIFWAIDKIFFKKSKRHYTKKEKARRISRTFYYLKGHGHIRMKPTGRDFIISLTKLGRKKLEKMNFETLGIEKPNSWDRKWWGVAADIPTEDYKWAADLFRKKLKELKFFHLQRTLWFYPYDPRKEIEFITQHFGIARFVTVMEVDRLDQDDESRMKKFFEDEGIL